MGIRMRARPTSHSMIAIIMLSLSMLISSADKMKDMQVLKREIFLQKLAAKIDQHTGTRMKRDIVSIHSPPPAPVLISGEDENQSPNSGHCTIRSININFDQIGWTHILAPKQISYQYCAGVCDPVTVGPQVFTTSAAYVLYKLGMSGNTVLDSACCSPNHLSSLELLVTKHNQEINQDNPLSNLEVITIPDMLVT